MKGPRNQEKKGQAAERAERGAWTPAGGPPPLCSDFVLSKESNVGSSEDGGAGRERKVFCFLYVDVISMDSEKRRW